MVFAEAGACSKICQGPLRVLVECKVIIQELNGTTSSQIQAYLSVMSCPDIILVNNEWTEYGANLYSSDVGRVQGCGMYPLT